MPHCLVATMQGESLARWGGARWSSNLTMDAVRAPMMELMRP